jgi:hypothetical protein
MRKRAAVRHIPTKKISVFSASAAPELLGERVA